MFVLLKPKTGLNTNSFVLKNANPAGFTDAELISPPRATIAPPMPLALAVPPCPVIEYRNASIGSCEYECIKIVSDVSIVTSLRIK